MMWEILLIPGLILLFGVAISYLDELDQQEEEKREKGLK